MTITISCRQAQLEQKQYVVRDSLFNREQVCESRQEAQRVKNHWMAEGLTKMWGRR